MLVEEDDEDEQIQDIRRYGKYPPAPRKLPPGG